MVVGVLRYKLLRKSPALVPPPEFQNARGLTTGAAAYCWGEGGSGELGDGSTNDHQTTPGAVSGGLTFFSVSAGLDHSCGVTASGAAYCWGWPSSGKLGDGSKRPGFTPMAVAPPVGGQ